MGNTFGAPKDEVIVIVDPASTGGMVVLEANQRKAPVICIWSDACGDDLKTHVPAAAKGIV